ncbi:MAG: hypothetical protein OIF34_11235, partial [Porticoccaceae bacterium]|nr:hypothetical protein [Porticoccaceae bacterium]
MKNSPVIAAFSGVLIALCGVCLSAQADTAPAQYKLVWQDEFDCQQRLNAAHWSYEQGFVRNQELQWYQADN